MTFEDSKDVNAVVIKVMSIRLEVNGNHMTGVQIIHLANIDIDWRNRTFHNPFNIVEYQ